MCVLSSVSVAVFDRDQLTCIKRVCLYRYFNRVLLVVWVDPNLFLLFPAGGSGLQRNASSNHVVDLGEVTALFSQQFGRTGQPYLVATTMTLHVPVTSCIT